MMKYSAKKIITTAVLCVLSVLPLSADFELTLIDNAGIETKQCVKSYSFSNNLASLSRENGTNKDIYSFEETLTNKNWLGKPVYRKVYRFNDFVVPYSSSSTSKWTSEISPEVDEVVKVSFKGYANDGFISESDTRYAIYNGGGSTLIRADYSKSLNKARVILRQSKSKSNPWNITELTIIVEYTKTTDIPDESSNQFKSYLHFVPSSSENDGVTTVDLENTGVRLLKDFIYDTTLNSCTKK